MLMYNKNERNMRKSLLHVKKQNFLKYKLMCNLTSNINSGGIWKQNLSFQKSKCLSMIKSIYYIHFLLPLTDNDYLFPKTNEIDNPVLVLK